MGDELRERIAEACRKANTGLFGDGPADDWDQLADAVLSALGLEQVGWLCAHEQSVGRRFRLCAHDSPCGPVYRLSKGQGETNG